jgi:predicted RNA-binding Zn-ribbon protein involved in translation (DUF1610 family)
MLWIVVIFTLAFCTAILFRTRLKRRLGLAPTLRELEERDRQRAERCQQCGYDLTKIESLRCPECGEVRLYPPKRSDSSQQGA